MAQLEIDGELHLRPIALTDAGELFSLVDRNRQHLRPWMSWVSEIADEDLMESFIEKYLQRERAGMGVHYTVIRSEQIVGVCVLKDIDSSNRVAEIGYWLGVEATGRGIMHRALSRLLDHGCSQLNLHRVELKVEAENKSSVAVARRLGFRKEGVLRDCAWIDGRAASLTLFSLLEPEWNLSAQELQETKVETKSVPFTCPKCARRIFNRRVDTCEFCDAPLPERLLLSQEQQSKMDQERHEYASDMHKRDQAMQKLERTVRRRRGQGFHFPGGGFSN